MTKDLVLDELDNELDELEALGEGKISLKEIIVEAPQKRLDAFIPQELPDLTRSRVQKLIKDGDILVNGKSIKANSSLAVGDKITIKIPEVKEVEIYPQNIPLDVVYEDSDIIVVNKPCGMVVHPAPGNPDGTLVNALLYHCKDLSGINGEIRPGIVHRIDKETSGLIIMAKNDQAHLGLQKQWQTGEMNRYYTALLYGNIIEPNGRIEANIGRSKTDRKKMAVTPDGGREAITNYKVLERFIKYTLIEAKLETGRTHQIRVHMSYLKHPVVGDIIYGPQKNAVKVNGQFLHSTKMAFKHPITGKDMYLEAPLPKEFENFLKDLRTQD